MIGSTNVRHQHYAPKSESICGPLRILSTARDCSGATVALLEASGLGTHHYHRETTEFYYVVDGHGDIRLGDEVFPVRPGSFLVVPPNVGHQVMARDGILLKVLVIASPAWREDDEFVIEASESASAP
ncbi:MAG: cupin domain-containing protein [Candidatus Kerfeldbacteria bacterium]|nr:cupin domain-containing protein [Candidatus Kerfeldbacteria bacterium]